MRRFLASLFVALLCGCSVMRGSSAAYVLTPRELNTHSEQYDGREVVVRGFVILGTNARSLYQSKERLEEFGRAVDAPTPGFNLEFEADCLTLLNAKVLEENSSVFNGQTITVRGRFVRKYLTGDVVDLQACGGPTAFILDEGDTRRLLRDLKAATVRERN